MSPLKRKDDYMIRFERGGKEGCSFKHSNPEIYTNKCGKREGRGKEESPVVEDLLHLKMETIALLLHLKMETITIAIAIAKAITLAGEDHCWSPSTYTISPFLHISIHT